MTPPASTPIQIPGETRPVLLVVIDTEEEFDWEGEFSRDATDVSSLLEIAPVQAVLDEFGVRPTYVMDYPMATRPESVGLLRGLRDDGRAELGIHLHAWVNPPFTEPVNRRNSYQGNLPPALEREKLERLHAAFERSFGCPPRVHKAGRYGLGPHSAGILRDLGIRVDLSIAPAFDFSGDGGPDYSAREPGLCWLAEGLLGIPTTGSFIGPLSGLGPGLYSSARQRRFLVHGLSRILSRGRLLERIMLSPEGHSLEKLERLTRSLVDTGHRILTFSFHSSSVRPGATTYVRSADDLKDFIVRCRQYFEFFFGSLNGVAMTATEVHDLLRPAPARAAS